MSVIFKSPEQNKRIKELIEFLKSEKIIRNQQQFVEMIDSDRTTVSKIVNGKQSVPIGMFDRIVSAFPNVSRDWLLTGTGKMVEYDNSIVFGGDENTGLMQVMKAQQENISRLIEQMDCIVKTNMTISKTNEELVKTNNMLVQILGKRGLAEDASGAAKMAVAVQG